MLAPDFAVGPNNISPQFPALSRRDVTLPVRKTDTGNYNNIIVRRYRHIREPEDVEDVAGSAAVQLPYDKLLDTSLSIYLHAVVIFSLYLNFFSSSDNCI
ncbi:unnamed protein product [Lasius platythorax]|uniref:Uncharacterized protein n=1 Tax=Lasius platythorax TaxID=488582 RepID=A0AAV2P3J2_9HYME